MRLGDRPIDLEVNHCGDGDSMSAEVDAAPLVRCALGTGQDK
jgi:hypothetical protein